MKKIVKQLVSLVTVFLFGCGALSADWDPEYCVSEGTSTSLEALKSPQFQQLKKDVKTYLKGSWCSEEKADLLLDLVVLTKPAVCVEVGACTGSSVLPVAAALKHVKQGKVFAIDAWSNAEVIKNLDQDDPNRAWWSTVNMKGIRDIFNTMVAKWGLSTCCVAICSPSSKAVDQIKGNIDFLHLDGDYSEIGSVQDVQLYLPKVKSGGYILLSNLFTMVKGKQPKLKAFCELFDSCEVVAEIEHDNAVLFRKM